MGAVRITGGEKFQAAMMALAEKVRSPRTLRVGFLEGAKYPDGTPVAMVAVIQNYGAPRAGIPPRPFFSNVVAEKSEEWPGAIAGLLKTTNFDIDKTLAMTGEAIKGQIQNEIFNGSFTPLAPATVKRKGFDKPLVYTGHMASSVDYEIV